jgi:Zn-dependent protease
LPSDSLPQTILLAFVYLNIVLAVFNLLPIPPLDGGRVMVGILPDKMAYHYAQLEHFGIPIVILLMITHLLDKILYPLVHWFCVIIGVPILV